MNVEFKSDGYSRNLAQLAADILKVSHDLLIDVSSRRNVVYSIKVFGKLVSHNKEN